MTQHYDVCVLGSGAVGQTVAHAARRNDLTVLVVEKRVPGGTCPNRGCDAKKPYVNAAGLAYRAGLLHKAGGGIEAPAIDWAQIARFKRTFTGPVGEITTKELEDAGATLARATPAFTGPNTLELDGCAITADRFVIATGQRPRELDVPGAEHTLNSDELLDLDDLPERVVFIGGGYIGMEFACAAAAAGRDVTVVAPGNHVLPAFDADVVEVMERALPDLGVHGIRLVTGRRVGAVRLNEDGSRTVLANNDEQTELATADLVVNATGRIASTEGLHLEAAGVEHSPRGVVVDDHLRCPGNDAVWAGGDVADNERPALIPTAVEDGRVLAHNMFSAESEGTMRERPSGHLCSIVFTTPAVASVGLTEREACERHGDGVHAVGGAMSTKKFFRELGQPHVAYKFIFAPDKRLIGAHFAGEGADEVINLFGLVIGEPGDTHPIYSATLTYPSISAALQGVFRSAVKSIPD